MEDLASLQDARKTGGAGENSELYGKTSDADCRKDTSMGRAAQYPLEIKLVDPKILPRIISYQMGSVQER